MRLFDLYGLVRSLSNAEDKLEGTSAELKATLRMRVSYKINFFADFYRSKSTNQSYVLPRS